MAVALGGRLMPVKRDPLDALFSDLVRERANWTALLASKSELDEDTGCIVWQGYLSQGYGRLGMGGTAVLAHRLSWALYHLESPGGRLVCHHCDRPACINPEHLFVGTVIDNNRDRHRKGRSVMPGCIGSRHGMSRLTENDVRRIKDMRRDGMTAEAIASHFPVSHWAIH